MGGEPVAAFLSLALPRDVPQSWVNRFAHSLISLAERYGVTLAGGDTAESPNGILADIVVVGTVPKGKAVLRSGARPGDRIYVSGELGGSAAAVSADGKKIRKKPKRKLNPRRVSSAFLSRAANRARPHSARERPGFRHDRHQRRPLHRPGPPLRRKSASAPNCRRKPSPAPALASHRAKSICSSPCTAEKTTNCCSPHPAASESLPALPELPITQIGHITRRQEDISDEPSAKRATSGYELRASRLGTLPQVVVTLVTCHH